MVCVQLVLLTVCLTSGVLCETQNATTPALIQALSGSCVVIPCSFEVPSHIDRASLISATEKWTWYSEFDRTSPRSVNAVQLGDLGMGDCTSQINDLKESGVYGVSVDAYFSWIDISFLSEVLVEVKDTPPEPIITPSTVIAWEGDTVTLFCSAPAPCPALIPTLTWRPALGDSVEALKENIDKTKTMTSTLTFTASRYSDGQTIFCSARYERQSHLSDLTSEDAVLLTVYLCSKPLTIEVIDPTGEVLEGTSVTMRCSCTSNPPIEEYRWYRVNGDRETLVGFRMMFTTRVTKHNSNFVCEAISWDHKEKSTVINLLPAATDLPRDTNVSVSLSSLSMTLTCRTNCTSEVSYAWYKVVGGKSVLITTTQSLTLQDTSEIGLIYCKAQNQLGTDISDLFLPVLVDSCVQDGKISASIPFIICGVVTVLWISTIVFGVYKYMRLSRRVAQGEAGDKTYATLEVNNITSEYSIIHRQGNGGDGANRRLNVYENATEVERT